MFDRFTDRSRKAMGLARQEALRLRHDYIGTEHMLLGVVLEGSGIAASVLRGLDVDLGKVRAGVEERVPPGTAEVVVGQIPFTPQAKKALEWTMEEAQGLGHGYLGTEHMLLGLIREEAGTAAQVLASLGVGLEPTRQGIRDLVGAEDLEEVLETEGTERPLQVPGIRSHLDTALRHLARVQALLPEDPRPSLPLDAEAEEALGMGADRACEEGRTQVSSLHVLLGLVEAGPNEVTALFDQDLGLDPAALREAIAKRLASPDEDARPAP